jgi:hypothetical protein
MKTSTILAICLAAFAPTSAKEISPMTKAESYVVANDLLARRRVKHQELARSPERRYRRRTRAPSHREISISARIA